MPLTDLDAVFDRIGAFSGPGSQRERAASLVSTQGCDLLKVCPIVYGKVVGKFA